MELAFDNIEKSFGTHRVLDGISLVAESGKACGLLGRNGAGKTTAIRILTDVLPADGGRILVDGKPIDYRTLKFGYLPEERGLYPKKKIIEQLVYFAQLKGMNTADATAASDRWLARLGMSEYRNRKLETLSKGNQQKIQLITALTHDPDIIILDEPFSGLDPVNAKLLSDVVVEEIERGKIVFFSSHQMNYIEEFCDRIAILHGGKIAVCGALTDIKRSFGRDRLEVRGPDAAAIAARFGDSAKLEDDGAVVVRLSDPAKKMSVMTKLASEFDLDSVAVKEPSMNDIFVHYAADHTETEDEL
jgi:ABC-2 type transport system ATP-binding protein